MLKFIYLFINDLVRIFARSAVYVLLAIIASLITGYVWGDSFAEGFTPENAYVLNTLRYAFVGVWGLLFMFAAIMVVVVTCQWFGEDMLTNRSYLNHMLPVYTWELVLSKALAGLAVIVIAVGIMTVDVIKVADHISIVGDILGIIPDLAESDGLDFDLSMFIKLGVYFILMLCLFIMSAAFLALSFGQLLSKGIGRDFMIFIGFFAVLFVSLAILVTVLRSAGVIAGITSIDSIQSVFDLAKSTLKCISNTNLVLSILFMTGASLILTYRLNV